MEDLQRVFTATRGGRKLNRSGYLRFRHWRLYAERGLADDAVAVWLAGDVLTVTFADEPLAQYAVTYQPDQHQVASVTEQQVFETPYRSPQRPLWEGRPEDWLTVIRLQPYAPRRRSSLAPNVQLRLQLANQEQAADG